MTGPSITDIERVASTFGVGMEQVRRDHLISHVLAAIATDISTYDVVFFGGTALSRTHLAEARLSEDIDLIARIHRGEIAKQIERAVRRGLARSHGRPTWRPALTATTGSQPTVLSVPDGTSVQVMFDIKASRVGRIPPDLMEMIVRHEGGPMPPLRHVLLGMNAHINYDLPQAIVAVVTAEDFDTPSIVERRRGDHQRIDQVLASRVSAEDSELAALGGRSLLDRLLTPLNQLGTKRFLTEARRKVWDNARQLDAARRRGGGAYQARLAELEDLRATRVTDLRAPGQVLLKLAVRGFGVRLPDGVAAEG